MSTTPRRFKFPFVRKRTGDTPSWKLEQQGSLLALACCDCHYQPQPGRRGQVEWFSNASRLRLLKKLARVCWRKMGQTQLLTLTYPDDHADGEYADRTRQRDALAKWINRQLPCEKSILWKVEWKPRKSGRRKGEVLPHMHLCVFNTAYLDWKATAEHWARIVGAPWCDVDGRRSRGDGVARYTAKYCAKDESENVGLVMHHNSPRKKGRAWGWLRQDLVPWDSRIQVSELTEDQVERALRVALSEMGKEPREGFTLFDADAAQVAAFILGTCEEDLDDGIFPE